MLDWVVKLMTVLVALLAIIIGAGVAVVIAIFNQWGRIRRSAQEDVRRTKKAAEEAQEAAIAVKKLQESLEKDAKDYGERIRIPAPGEEITPKVKEQLDELSRRLERVEAFGGSLKTEDYFNRGVDYYSKKDYKSALKAFEKSLELDPESYKAWLYKGLVLRELGQYENALEAYDKALEIQNYFSAWHGKGEIFRRINRYDDAIDAFSKAIELQSNYNFSWYERARIYVLKGEKGPALADLKKAIEIADFTKSWVRTDKDFESLWDDPDFNKLVE